MITKINRFGESGYPDSCSMPIEHDISLIHAGRGERSKIMKKRTTKHALLTSVMSLVLCFAMLLGTTFAWFTDTASTAVNKIQAGNLDIVVE